MTQVVLRDSHCVSYNSQKHTISHRHTHTHRACKEAPHMLMSNHLLDYYAQVHISQVR